MNGSPSTPGKRPRRIATRLFFTSWLLYVLHFATNIEREHFLAISLGDDLSVDVSQYLGLHDDIFEVPGRGAFINNNPGASILGAIPYALARPVIDPFVRRVQNKRVASGRRDREYKTTNPEHRAFFRRSYERGLDVKLGLAAGVMQVLVMAPVSALSVVVMFGMLRNHTESTRAALLLALLYGFATPVFYRSAQLNHNLLAGHCALFAFALLRAPGKDPTRPRYLWAGLLCGGSVLLDYSGVPIALALGLYGLARRSSLPAHLRSRTDALYFILGVMPGVTMLLGYQWLCFGSPWYPAQHYMTAWKLYIDEGFVLKGYRGMDWPTMGLLYETAFGIRFGLFTFSPLLLLALCVPAWFRKNGCCIEMREMRLIALFCLALFVFCAANQFAHWQVKTGVRHIVPATPFLFLAAAEVLLRLPVRTAAVVGVVSTYWSWCLAMYRDVEHGWGVFDAVAHITVGGFRLPWVTTLERMGYVSEGTSVLPLLMLAGGMVWILWRVGPRPDHTA